jgi:acetoin utilization protein AcuB
MRVRELMSRRVTTIAQEATCLEAVELMCRRKVRHLPVLAPNGRLVGLVTDRDVRHRLFASDVYSRIGSVPVSVLLGETPVRSVMSTPVRCIAASAEVAEAADRMRREKVGCLPVVDGRRVVGILTEIDVLRRIAGAEVGEDSSLDIVVSYP